jgi:GT2 family glycosyltransferase
MISLIVLSYNNFLYYKQCLSSILNQSYDKIELILSDDCSERFNEEKIISYINANKKSNLKKIVINKNKTNLGIVKNYNKAISLASGDYIFYLAIDDVLYDNKVLEDVVKYFICTGSLIFTGYKDVYDETMTKYIKTLPRPIEVEFLKKNNPEYLYEKLCKGSFISGSNTPFSRKLIEKYGYLDERYFYLEDYPRYLSLTKKGCNISFYDRKLIKYRMGGVTTKGIINESLRKDLFLATIYECKDYFQKVWDESWTNKDKIVAWGSGDCFESSVGLIDFKIDYIVDSNEKVQGTEVKGFKVLSPEALKNEDREKIFIFVFSYANYFDIAASLNKLGYIEFFNYFVCTPNILKAIKS